MPIVDLALVEISEKPQLWQDLQEYLAELSRISGLPLRGEIPYRYFDLYWQEPDRWPFWIKSQDKIAGFALIRKREDGVFSMAEFYVKPAYRRGGIGTAAARALFARFEGRWHVSEFTKNSPAIAFWRQTLEGFVKYRETATPEHVEQNFEMPPAPGIRQRNS